MGKRSEAVGYFANLGYVCPKFYNPADYLIEELAVMASRYKKSMAKLKRISDAYTGSDLAKENSAWMKEVPQVKQRYFVTRSYAASRMTQFIETYKRSLKSYAR